MCADYIHSYMCEHVNILDTCNFFCICVCVIYSWGGGSCYYMAFSDSVGALLGRDWNCKCSCHCLNMPEFV